ncbi:MAG TPA: hypothetical protein DIC22_03140 [Chitinophagaceae bacterium]|jgi:hypothetical protein|nr:hypothetical protein [Chitinophagaceae bacterium]
MHFLYRALIFISLTVFTVCYSCSAQNKSKKGVEQAMKKYDLLILSMNTDSIARLYTPDGELGNMARGRDSIRNFLNGFKNFKVLSQVSETKIISIEQDTAILTGTYKQTVIVPVNDTVMAKGLFTVKWIWLKQDGWHIQRMDTQPVK